MTPKRRLFQGKGDFCAEYCFNDIPGTFLAFILPDDHGCNVVLAEHPDPGKRGRSVDDATPELIDALTIAVAGLVSTGIIRFFTTHALACNDGDNCRVDAVVLDEYGAPEIESVPDVVQGWLLERTVELARAKHDFIPSRKMVAEIRHLSTNVDVKLPTPSDRP